EFMRAMGLHARDVALLPEGRGFLLVELGADSKEESLAHAKRLCRDVERPTKLYDDPATARRIWEIRESGLGATAHVPGRPDAWPGWEDAAVPPQRLGAYLRDFHELMHQYGYEASVYGHF